MADTPKLRGIPPEVAVGALVGAAALPLGRLFRPGGLGEVVLLSIGLSLLVSGLARRLRAPFLLGWLASAVSLGWFIAVRFFPETLWTLLPTPRTVAAVVNAVFVGVDQAVQDVAPVPPTRPLLMFVAVGVWVTVWLADAARDLGNPVLAIASTVPLYIAPGALMTTQRRWLETALYLGAAAAVLFLEQRARSRRWGGQPREDAAWRPGPAARVALTGSLAVVALTPLLPGYGAPPLLKTRGPGERVAFNPLVAIKPTLDSRDVRVLFTVRTSRPSYYRLTALNEFDGRVWRQSKGEAPVRVADGLLGQPTSAVITQRFDIRALAGPWLPAAYRPVAIRGAGQVLFEAQTRTLLREQGFDQGLRYSVVSEPPGATAEELDKIGRERFVGLERYTRLPVPVARSVRQIAQRIAGEQPSPYRQVVAIQNHLRTFKYDERVAAGHSFDTIVEFLTKVKRGYCEQFAGSMAVLARSLGLPARVAIGFGYGAPLRDGRYHVTTEQAHAWVEVFFPGAGWVPFEPTPRGGVAVVPDHAVPPALGQQPEPSVDPSEQPVAEGEQQQQNRRPLDAGPGDRATGRSGGRRGVVALAAAMVAGVLALGVLALLRHRRRRHAAPREIVSGCYADFLAWCAAAGFGRHSGETPREHSGRLGSVSSSAADPLARLASAAEEALWAPPNGLDPDAGLRAAEEARSALAATLPVPRRLLATARSLVRL